MSYIALDPSTTNTGLVYYNDSIDFLANIKPSGDNWVDKCINICREIKDYLKEFEPDIVVSERVHVGPNRQTAMKLSELHGMIRQTVRPLKFKRAAVKKIRKSLGINPPRKPLTEALHSLFAWIQEEDPTLLYDIKYFLRGVGDKTVKDHLTGVARNGKIAEFLRQFKDDDITPEEVLDKAGVDHPYAKNLAKSSDTPEEFIDGLLRDDNILRYEEKWDGKTSRKGTPKIGKKKIPVFNYIYDQGLCEQKIDDNVADAIATSEAYRKHPEVFTID